MFCAPPSPASAGRLPYAAFRPCLECRTPLERPSANGSPAAGETRGARALEPLGQRHSPAGSGGSSSRSAAKGPDDAHHNRLSADGEWKQPVMPRRLIVFNVVLGLASLTFTVGIVRALLVKHPIPPPATAP